MGEGGQLPLIDLCSGPISSDALGDQIIGAIEQASGALKTGHELVALTRQLEVGALFKQGNGGVVIIDGKYIVQTKSTDRAKTFTGASDSQIKRYFEDLTGQPLPTPRIIPPHNAPQRWSSLCY